MVSPRRAAAARRLSQQQQQRPRGGPRTSALAVSARAAHAHSCVCAPISRASLMNTSSSVMLATPQSMTPSAALRSVTFAKTEASDTSDSGRSYLSVPPSLYVSCAPGDSSSRTKRSASAARSAVVVSVKMRKPP